PVVDPWAAAARRGLAAPPAPPGARLAAAPRGSNPPWRGRLRPPYAPFRGRVPSFVLLTDHSQWRRAPPECLARGCARRPPAVRRCGAGPWRAAPPNDSHTQSVRPRCPVQWLRPRSGSLRPRGDQRTRLRRPPTLVPAP